MIGFAGKSAFLTRMARLRRASLRAPSAGLLVTSLPNIRYLTGFTGSVGVLGITQKSAVFHTAGLYRTQARKEITGAKVRVSGHPSREAVRRLAQAGARKVIFEADHLTAAELTTLEKVAGPVSLQAGIGKVEGLRSVKNREEVARIRASQALTARVFEEVLPLVRPGVRERELAAEIEYRMKQLGADGPSFDTIVASGPRSALPHGRAGERKLRRNELVVFDLGAILGGYCSDMTRTVFLGKPSAAVRRVYRAVQDALEKAREAVRAGAEASDVDAAARKLLSRRRLGRYFVHSTGHGLGLEVHEAPGIGLSSSELLRSGMVITLEPGAYIQGLGGVRIEDVVVVRRRGCETLTPLPTEMICL